MRWRGNVPGELPFQIEKIRRIYRLDPTAVAALRDQLDTYWNRALANYGEVVEEAVPERGEDRT